MDSRLWGFFQKFFLECQKKIKSGGPASRTCRPPPGVVQVRRQALGKKRESCTRMAASPRMTSVVFIENLRDN